MDSEKRKLEMREAWLRATDEDVLRAAGDDWNEYCPEAKIIINEEIKRRNLNVNTKPTSESFSKSKERLSQQIGRFLFLLSFLGLYIALNFGLWVFYEWRESQVLPEVDRIEAFLDKKKSWLNSAKLRLRTTQSQIEPYLTQDEASNIAPRISLKKIVNLEEEYETLYSEYESRRQIYNKKVERYNELLDKIDTRWYVFPIPVRR
jgi:hypothetical protein